MLVFAMLISLFISCTKDMEPVIPVDPPIEGQPGTPDPGTPEPGTPEPGTPDPGTPEPGTPDPGTPEPGAPNPGTPNPGTPQNGYEMGAGSGTLVIDGSNEFVKGKNLIIIKAGRYSKITIQNLNGTKGNPVLIKNGGQVYVTGSLTTNNINHVTFAGDNVLGMEYGFNFHDLSYRAVLMSGKMNGVTLKNLSFKNVPDYVLYADLGSMKHQGNADTRTEDFKILNCKFDNVKSLQFGGTFSASQDEGFIKNLEIAHNTFINSNPGVFVFAPNVQDYDIHHNTVNNVNPTNNNHNGIFQMIGNGKFHDNKFTNYQGNMIRAWVFSRGSNPATVEIYNNTGYNTRKYGAFEIQGFARYIVPGKTTFVNAKVYNNTAGKMNTSKSWEGVMLDLYNFGGTLEYYNNLGFDLVYNKTITDMLNNMSDTKIIKNTNNKYFNSSSDAVSNLTSFSSKHPGIGAVN